MKTHKNHLRLLILLLLVLLACIGYMTVGVHFENQKLFAYAMRIRTPKLIAMLITAFAIGSASIVFQSIINNTIVTPCLLGMDQLYSLIHTAVFFVAGSGSFLAVNANAAFAVDLAIMGAVATVIYSYLFQKTNHNVLYVLLIGTVLTSFFSSIQTTLTRVMDPNEYDTLLTDLVASFSNVNSAILVLSVAVLALVAFAFRKELALLDVLTLGKDQAINLGVDYDRCIRRLLLGVTLYIATATAMVGPLAFLGLIIAIGVGTAVGLNALLSRKLGQKKPEEACRAATTGLFLMLGTSLVFTLVGLLFSNQIAAALTNDPELQQLCREYLSVNLVFCWGIFLQTYGQRLLQAVGDTVLSMVSLIIGAVVNIILDPIMIFGLLGCPAMGIRGAAIATVIGQLIGAAAALWFNRLKNPVIHVRLKDYRFRWQDVADIYRVGLPTIVMQAIGSVMTFAVNGILLGVSSTAVAFFGIYYKLQNFLMMPVNGLGQAAIPVVGFNYGSGQSDRVKQAWKVLLPTGVVFALCGTAVFLLFPAQLLGLFSASDEMLAFGVPALRIISVTFLFAVTTILCGYFASGLGNGVVNMIGGALRQLVVLVPCLWLLIRTMGIDKAWFAFWMSEVIACAYSLWATKKELRNKGK